MSNDAVRPQKTLLIRARTPVGLLLCAVLSIAALVPVFGQSDGAGGGDLRLDFYYSEGCRACLRFINDEIPETASDLGVEIEINTYDLLTPPDFERFQAEVIRLGVEVTEVPVAVVGPVVLQGDEEIRRRLEPVLRRIRDRMEEGDDFASAAKAVAARTSAGDAKAPGGAGGTDTAAVEPSEAVDSSAAKGKTVLALPVLAAGLLDGVNPCAFTTLIFLLAALAVAGRSRREILVLGLFFSLAVFVTYFLIGLGFFQALRAASSFPVVALVIRWVLFAVLIVFAALSVYDWSRIRAGDTSGIVLQLPTAMKRRIHGSIRSRARSTALAGSALVLGVLVSVFELACTGQVYFPTLTYMTRVDANVRSYLLLTLYNIGFILPLLAVFGLSYAGVSSQRITQVFQAHLGTVKLATAGLFVGLAVLTIGV